MDTTTGELLGGGARLGDVSGPKTMPELVPPEAQDKSLTIRPAGGCGNPSSTWLVAEDAMATEPTVLEDSPLTSSMHSTVTTCGEGEREGEKEKG